MRDGARAKCVHGPTLRYDSSLSLFEAPFGNSGQAGRRGGHPKRRGTKAQRDSSRAGGTFGREGRARQRVRNDGPGGGHSDAQPRVTVAHGTHPKRQQQIPRRYAPRDDTKHTAKVPRARDGEARRGALGYKGCGSKVRWAEDRLRVPHPSQSRVGLCTAWRVHGKDKETAAGLKSPALR